MELTGRDSQGEPQSASAPADTQLRRVIDAWQKLPTPRSCSSHRKQLGRIVQSPKGFQRSNRTNNLNQETKAQSAFSKKDQPDPGPRLLTIPFHIPWPSQRPLREPSPFVALPSPNNG